MAEELRTEALIDPRLKKVREEIKNVMLPTLITIFELRSAAQQAGAPRSRLQKPLSKSLDEICKELKHLNEDLKQLRLWCLSCEMQIEKALKDPAESYVPKAASVKESEPHSLQKSFTDALSAQQALFGAHKAVATTSVPNPPSPLSKQSLWTKLAQLLRR